MNSTKVDIEESYSEIYRVCNQKKHITIIDEIIESVAYSETIPIKISTNSFNSY